MTVAILSEIITLRKSIQLDTRGPIVIHSGNSVPGGTTVLNSQWTAYNILVENNTIIDSTQSILFCGKYSYHAKDVVIKNNLIVSKQNEAAFRFDKGRIILFILITKFMHPS